MESNIQPRVTFIIAHHNYEEYLSDAIQSAINQTYDNIKICIIDDCSNDPDAVKNIISVFDCPQSESIQNHLQILEGNKITTIFITDKARGPSYARNRGMEYMMDQTDIFAILDADDENLPTKIERCVDIITEYPDQIGVVYADHYTINTKTGRTVIEYREPFDLLRLNRECIVHSGSVVTKHALLSVVENNQIYDESMRTCEDYDLWMRIAEKFVIIHIAEPLSVVKVQPKNSSDTVAQEVWNNNYRKVFQKKYNRQ